MEQKNSQKKMKFTISNHIGKMIFMQNLEKFLFLGVLLIFRGVSILYFENLVIIRKLYFLVYFVIIGMRILGLKKMIKIM